MGMIIATNAFWEVFPKDEEAKVVFLHPYNEMSEKVDIIILMCEKIFSEKGIPTLNKLYDIIATYPREIPCYLIGVGSNIKNNKFSKFAEPRRDLAMRRFINEVLKRSKSIGIRGELNKEWLTKYFGYKDNEIDIIFDKENKFDKSLLRFFLVKNNIKGLLDESRTLAFQRKKKICYDYLKPHVREIIIRKPQIEIIDNVARLNCIISIDGEDKLIYLETENKWKDYLETTLADPFLLGVLPYAMRTEHDIVTELPVSEELLHNIVEVLIPNMCHGDSRLYNSKIDCETISLNDRGNAVGVGFSCGVDSFYSLYHYSNSKYKELKPTHLYVGNYVYTSAMDVIYERVEKVANEVGLDVVKTNTNITEAFSGLTHLYVHFYKTLFGVLCLRKLFGTYIYATGLDATHFSLANCGTADTAYYEILLAYVINSRIFRFIDGGIDVERTEKTLALIKYPPSYNNLNVCLDPSLLINCGVCGKCLRTLLTLDLFDALDLYRGSFDIDAYMRDRKKHIKFMIENKTDKFLKELLPEFVKKDPGLIEECSKNEYK